MSIQSIKGFTLIELVIVMVIVSILATMTTDIMIKPVKSYIDLERRSTLVNSAEIAIRRIQRDIRRALPNSIRISGGGTVIELLHTTDGGRYRAKKAVLADDELVLTALDSSFDVMGSLNMIPSGELVIYNLGSVTADAYAGNNRETIANTSTHNSIMLSSAKRFPFPSPQQRFFIVDTPITYSCADSDGDGFTDELRRYDNYSITSANPNLATLSFNRQAKSDRINCSFRYDAGTATRAGLVIIEIKLTDAVGESAKLIHQVHVDNVP
ncbi:MAG: prepilin-type N-terminal cleavage/methylation domain-containing protein [Methylococcales bacterium]|nr:prepilin-type N-terminal cleavage/methylation domain-containing protein [Methylococcales bacterium]